MIFTIGGFDAAAYLVQDNFSVSSAPQFDAQNSFLTLDGTSHGERYLGDIVTIKADLMEIPTEAAETLSRIFEQAFFDVWYSDPICKTAQFKKPEVTAVCCFEGDGTEYWNYSISMVSQLVPYNPEDTDCL